MARTLILDTHALLWFLQGDERLGSAAKAAIADADSSLIVPIIVLAEAIWIVERGRTNIPSPRALLAALDGDSRFQIIPLDRATVERTIPLSLISEMHDRQIVATTLSMSFADPAAALVSMDRQIKESGLVAMLW